MNNDRRANPIAALRRELTRYVLRCRPCDGSGVLKRGPGLGRPCPECAEGRQALAISAPIVEEQARLTTPRREYSVK